MKDYESNSLLKSIIRMIQEMNLSYSDFVSDIDDLKNGVILCDLINHILYDSNNEDLKNQVYFDENMSEQDVLSNLDLAMQFIHSNEKIQVPSIISSLDSYDIYENEQNLLKIFQFLESTHLKKPLNQSDQKTINIHKPPIKPILKVSNYDLPMKQTFVEKKQDQIEQTQEQPFFFSNMIKTQIDNKIAQKQIETQTNKIFDNIKQYQQTIQTNQEDQQYKIIQNGNKMFEKTTHNNTLTKLKQDLDQLDNLIQKEQEQDIYDSSQIYNKMKKSNSEKNLPKLDNIKQSQQLRSTSIREKRQNSEHNQIKITQIESSHVKKCLEWIYQRNLIKKGLSNIEQKLPKICKNGAIFIDLINKLESRGKENILKGCNLNSKNTSQINANLNKLFAYLRSKERLNNRYLWAQKYILEANFDVFWGLMDDLRYYYNNKISPNDERYKPKLINSQKDQNQLKTQNKKIEKDLCQSMVLSQQTIQEQNQIQTLNKPKQTITQTFTFQQIPDQNKVQYYSQIHQQKFQYSPKKKSSFNSLSDEKLCWVQNQMDSMGIQIVQNLQFFQNEQQSIMILGQLLQKTHNLSFNDKKIYKHDEINNVQQKIKDFILLKKINIPIQLWQHSEQILKQQKVLLAFCYYILKDKEQNHPLEIYLPYTESDIDELNLVLRSWVKKLLMISDIPIDWYKGFQDGVLLCRIVEIILDIEINPRHIYPKNQVQEIANIEQALNKLRSLKIGQKFLWLEHEIQKGNKYAILGLMEDLYRYYDNLPARQGSDYFRDGPYFGHQKSYNQHLNYLKSQEEQQIYQKYMVDKQDKNKSKDSLFDLKNIQSILKHLINLGFQEQLENISWENEEIKEFQNGQSLYQVYFIQRYLLSQNLLIPRYIIEIVFQFTSKSKSSKYPKYSTFFENSPKSSIIKINNLTK